MIIYPAIDLRGGKVVRLLEGDPERQTVFSDDPIATARDWMDQGAEWIHMVNLDGAFESDNENLRILEAVAALSVRVQFAGGLRDINAIGAALDAGAERLMIGTMAVREPDLFVEVLQRFGSDSIGVALDSRDGMIATHGWRETSTRSAIEFGHWMRQRGARHALYTDVARDGMLSGVDIEGTIALARETKLQVIASGGVSGLSEIRQLAASGMVAGAVIGMALYRKRFSLRDAIAASKEGD